MAAPSKTSPVSPWGQAVAGATGAVLANAAIYPLDIVKTRLQVQTKADPNSVVTNDDEPPYASTWDAIARIVEEEGVAGLYAGINGSLIGVASTNFAYFYCYSVVRSTYQRLSTVPIVPSMQAELALGAIAGAIAQLCTIPISVVTTRQQTQRKSDRQGLLDTAQDIISGPDGLFGLWRGLKASLVLVTNPAITYGAYERLKASCFPGRVNLRPWESFVLGAVSKSIATVVTQPLIVAKVGLQSRPPKARHGKPFRGFVEVMKFIVENEGVLGLFKGIAPQIMKGLLVQGILMMIKERLELSFVVLFQTLKSVHWPNMRQATARAMAAVASRRLASKS